MPYVVQYPAHPEYQPVSFTCLARAVAFADAQRIQAYVLCIPLMMVLPRNWH